MTDHTNAAAAFAGFPLTREQRAMLAQTQVAPAPVLRLPLPASTTPADVREALARLAVRHDVLRYRLQHVPGYRELRLRASDVAIELEELEVADDAGVQFQISRDQLRRFDAPDQPLLQARLLRRADGRAEHVLLLCCAPLIVDRLSLLTLAQDFDRLLAQPASLPVGEAEELFQFGQFSEWREELDNSEDAAAALAYWNGHLQTPAQAPQLSWRRSGNEVSGIRTVALPVPATLAEALNSFCQAGKVQAENVLHAAWLVLLARQTQGADAHDDGAHLSGWQHDCRRDYDMLQGAVGRFDKVLPLAMRIDTDLAFSAVVQQLEAVKQNHRDLQEHAPADHETHPAIGFTCVEAAAAFEHAGLPGPSPQFELALQIGLDGSSLSTTLHYEGHRYDAAAVRALLGQYQTLLGAALVQPQQAVGVLDALDDETRARLLASAVATAATAATETVAAMVAGWARRTPAALALIAGPQRIGYAELEQRVAALAYALSKQGVTPGSIVALQLPRSAELVLALLAVWRAGAAYLPLEPDGPSARRAEILKDADAVLLIGSAASEDLACPYLAWNELQQQAERAAQVGVALPDATQLDATAYVLYTSGSTGTPKGVVIGHAQLAAYVGGVSAALDLQQCRNWALTGTVAADLGNTALFGALANGACLSVAAAADMQDGAAFAGFMRRHAIDALKMVPSHLEALLETDAPVLPATLVLGGEASPAALVQKIIALAPASRLFNHYGPTECTVGVMVHRHVSADADQHHASLPLTQVLDGSRVYVLDSRLQPALPGAVGQLYIGGAQVCRGYLNGDGADVFIDDPFRPGQRLYRSGDLASWLPSEQGGLRLLGRADHQLKIRGFRIEPGEIEAVLLRQNGVRQVQVLPLHSEQGVELAACLLLEGQAEQAAQALDAARAALAAALPAVMQPSRWLALPAFPRLGNGKVDRKALLGLLEQDVHGEVGAAGDEARADPLQTLLLEQMAQLLERPRIALHDDFFALGGHSLLVIKLVARLRKLLTLEVPPALVFDHPDAAQLAQALRQAARAADASLDLDRLAQVLQQGQAGRDVATPAVIVPTAA